METNNTGRESEAICKHLNDTIEHYTDSMKNDNKASGVINTNCIIISLKVKHTAGRILLINLSIRCFSNKDR